MAQPKAKVTPSKKKSPPKRMLEVEDADSLVEFQKNARGVWRNEHGFFRKRRGRPTYLIEILNAIEELRVAGLIKEKTSQNRLIEMVREQLKKSAPSEKIIPHKDTIRPYAKVWLLAEKNSSILDYSDMFEWEWLLEKDFEVLFYELAGEKQDRQKGIKKP